MYARIRARTHTLMHVHSRTHTRQATETNLDEMKKAAQNP